jgi:hypothetical protein
MCHLTGFSFGGKGSSTNLVLKLKALVFITFKFVKDCDSGVKHSELLGF